jgi:hypothetical protein
MMKPLILVLVMFAGAASAASVGDVMDVDLLRTSPRASPLFPLGCNKWDDSQELFQLWSKGQRAAMDHRQQEINALSRGDDVRICKDFRMIVDDQRIVQKRPDSLATMAWFCITPAKPVNLSLFDGKGNPVATPACWWVRYPENPGGKK